MKQVSGLIVALLCGTACALAQTDGTVGTQADPDKIMGAEAAGIEQTINGYVQGAMHGGYLELFDPKKGELVALRLDQIMLDDPARVIFPKPGRVAICGECTQVKRVNDSGSRTQARELSDKYEVWFVVLRDGASHARVLDTFIKSANGQPMFEWHQDAAGEWSATVAPDEP